jgi:hypothetical protein
MGQNGRKQIELWLLLATRHASHMKQQDRHLLDMTFYETMKK